MSSGCTRRSFAESLALAALAPALGVRPETMVTTYARSVAQAPETAAASGLARALGHVIRAQYGARLGPTDLATITGQIQSSLDRAAQVRKVDLANGDEPDFVYSALLRPAESR